MKCYYHPEKDAVAVCKNCSKGICPQCAVDVGNGMACREKCEEKVKKICTIVERNLASFSTANQLLKNIARTYKIGSILFFIAGIAFLMFGVMENLLNEKITGIVVMLGSVFLYFQEKKYKKLRY